MMLLGSAVYSYALYNPKGSIDWRQDVTQGVVRVESIDTPDDVRRQVLVFAQKSGIVFGSFDFAVDGEGHWWFFEVNEQGQFLWLDELNPTLHVQEKFLAFLTTPEWADKELIESRADLFPSWKEYLDSPASNQQIPGEQSQVIPEFVSLE